MIEGLISAMPAVHENAYVTHVRQLMRDGYRSLPVVDDQSRVKGMVTLLDMIRVTSTKSDVTIIGYINETRRATPDMGVVDVARIFAETGFDIPVVRSHDDYALVGVVDLEHLFNSLDFKKNESVSAVMTKTVRTCAATDPVSKVWINMAQYGVSGCPIVKKKHLIGIITLKDLLKAGHVRLEREDERGGRGIYPPNVEKVMKTPVVTVGSDSSIWEAANLMIQYEIGRLPVVEDSKLIGIVDRQDLVRAIL